MNNCRVVGNSEKRVDAACKVTGKAVYPADIYMENMAFGYTVRSEKSSANICVDTTAADNYPGVLYVFTAKDVTGRNHYGVLFKDHQVFCQDRVRSIGESIAFVVAETAEAAEKAAKLVRIKYDELPAVFDPISAMQPDAPRVHTVDSMKSFFPQDDSNILYHYKLKKGNIKEAFSKCAVIVEKSYETSMVDHAFLQPEAGIAYIDAEGRVTVTAAAQYPHYDREEIADALGIGVDKIRVITAAVGGAFGGREDITMQIHLALAANKLKCPIKTTYTREESFIAHSKRHPMVMKYKTGALSDGTLYAMEAEIIGDSGAHASWAINILRKAGVHATGPYVIPNVNVDSYAVYTNNPFTGAMRGFGAAQVAMAYEQQIDEIAQKLGIDPVTIRLKNSFKLGSETATGQMLGESVPLDDSILKAVSKFGADQLGFRCQRKVHQDTNTPTKQAKPNKKRGSGIASIFYGTGYGNGFPDVSNASAELLQSGKVRVRAGATEVGQGAKTVLSQIAAEAMGVELEDIELINEDTCETPDSGTAAASRQTYNSGNGIRLACEKLKFSIMQCAAEIFEVNPFLDVTTSMDVNITDGAVAIKGLSEKKMKLKDIYDIAHKTGNVLREEAAFTARTTRMDANTGQGAPYWPYTFATFCVEVEVDTDTGKVDVIRAVCAQDVGKAVNPTLVEGQIEGGFAMGMSWVLFEDLGLLNGKIKNNNFSRYIIPTSLDMPDIENIIVEAPESSAPFGAKGIGEPVMLPAMPAILNAIYDAVGVRISKLPASPQNILAKLQAAAEEGDVKRI